MFDKTTLSILILRSTSYLHQIHDTTLFNNNLIQQLIHTNAMAYHTMQITNQSSGREERMIMLIIIFISQHKTFTHNTLTQMETHMEFQLIEWFQVWLVKTARTYSLFYHIFIELHCPAALISSIYKK